MTHFLSIFCRYETQKIAKLCEKKTEKKTFPQNTKRSAAQISDGSRSEYIFQAHRLKYLINHFEINIL